MSKKDDALDALYTAPLDAFIQRRKDAARSFPELGKLSKPKPSAWALNQLVRQERGAVERFLHEAGAFQHPAKGQSLTPEAWRVASVQLREHLRELVDSAEALLRTAGAPASRRTLEEVDATLRAAAMEREASEALLEGRLSSPLPASFGLGEAPAAPAAPATRRPASPMAAKKGATQRVEAQLERKQNARLQQLEREERRARDELAKSQQAFERAKSALERAQHKHQEAVLKVAAVHSGTAG